MESIMAKLSVKTKKILEIILTSIEVIVVLFLLLFSIFSAMTSAGGSFFGQQSYAVKTDSMAPEFNAGDLIFIEQASDESKKSYAIGDVIMFHMGNTENGEYNTHRVQEVLKDSSGSVYAYITKGDNAPEEDSLPVEIRYVVGRYTGFKLPVIGGMVSFTQEGNNFIFVVIVPLALLFLWNGYYFFRMFMKSSNEKAVENASALKEEEKQAILEEAKRQALEELQKKENENKEDVSKEEITEPSEEKNSISEEVSENSEEEKDILIETSEEKEVVSEAEKKEEIKPKKKKRVKKAEEPKKVETKSKKAGSTVEKKTQKNTKEKAKSKGTAASKTKKTNSSSTKKKKE